MSNKIIKLKKRASEIQSKYAKKGNIKKGSLASRAQSIADRTTKISKITASKVQSREAKKSKGEISKDSIVAKFQGLADT